MGLELMISSNMLYLTESARRPLGGFQCIAILNSAVVRMVVRSSLCTRASASSTKNSELLGHSG